MIYGLPPAQYRFSVSPSRTGPLTLSGQTVLGLPGDGPKSPGVAAPPPPGRRSARWTEAGRRVPVGLAARGLGTGQRGRGERAAEGRRASMSRRRGPRGRHSAQWSLPHPVQ